MKKLSILFVTLAIFACFNWLVLTPYSEARPLVNNRTFISEASTSEFAEILSTNIYAPINIPENLLSNDYSLLKQQVGLRCDAYPKCPDCDGRGNVCLGATEFYGGILMAVAKRNIILKCQRANALDYCGGSRGCMKKTRQEQQRHRNAYGGGCYKLCERVARCVVDNR